VCPAEHLLREKSNERFGTGSVLGPDRCLVAPRKLVVIRLSFFSHSAARLTFTLRQPPVNVFWAPRSSVRCLEKLLCMASFRLARQASRIAAWRMPRCSIACSTPYLSSTLQMQRRIPIVRYQQFTSTSHTATAAGKETMEESLRNMDLDAAEKHMKDWFGDHASWSHEQLLNLVYGTKSSSASCSYTNIYKRRTSYQCETCRTLVTTVLAVFDSAATAHLSHS